ncbi:MAG: serine/threonine protein kinase [Sandaracinaceae bacterium]
MSGPELVHPEPTTQRLGRYRLAYELASGGMATVYMGCIDGAAGFEKVVAIKRIHPHLAKEQAYVDMFLDEARLASRIEHPNVCGVTDFGEAEGSYFLVMEFLLGVPLNKLLARLLRMDVPPQRWTRIASRLLTDAAEGLHAAHELRDGRGEPLGVVHRDISPSNLFVGFDGTLRVVDFGIAKARDRLHQTATGEVKGKLAYMAPEQVRHADVDRRADVWALGVVGWEMLTLSRLFKRSNDATTLYAVLEHEVAPPSTLSSAVPSALDGAIRAALRRMPGARTADARAFGRAVRGAWDEASGRPADALEVGDLLRTLFPGEEERQRSLVSLAREQRAAIPVVGPAAPGEDSFSSAAARDAAEPSHTHTVDGPPKPAPITAASSTSLDGNDEPTDAAPSPRRVALFVALVLGMAAVLGAGSAGLLIALDEMSQPDEPARLVSAPLVSAPLASTPLATAPLAAPPGTNDAAPEEEPDAGIPDGLEPEPAPARPVSRRGRRRRRPPRPTSAPVNEAEAPGRVAVVVPGSWANVYDEGGRLLGPTPLSRPLPPGRHRLTLRFRGEPPAIPVVVDVPSGGTARVSRRDPRP